MNNSRLSAAVLRLDAGAEADRIVDFIRQAVTGPLRKQGVVVAVSGGVDSATTLALCVRALGAGRVIALLLPEQESDPNAVVLGRAIAEQLGVSYQTIDITPLLTAAGCYQQRDAAIREVFPEYQAGYKSKISLGGRAGESARLLYYNLTVQRADGQRIVRRLSTQVLRRIVAATNMKQRTRKAVEYYHADRFNYAVAGTANFLEHDQGFFVKLGDGAADLKPIAHLYKTQVRELAAFLQLPEQLLQRTPTTDTYTLEQTQEEFFFGLPFAQLDLLVFGIRQGYAADAIAEALGMDANRIGWLASELRQKRTATEPLRMPPLMLTPKLYFPTHCGADR